MSLVGYAVRRLAWSVATVAGVIAVTFVISHIIPADPAALVAGERATQEQIEALRRQLGFDQPLARQLFDYYLRVLGGDFGNSLFTNRAVVKDLVSRLPATIELTLAAMMATVAFGVPIGVLSALNRNSLLDHAVRFVTISGLAIASFWFAIILQLWLAMDLGWLPLGGRIGASHPPPPFVTGPVPRRYPLAADGAAFAAPSRTLFCPLSRLRFLPWRPSSASHAPACSMRSTSPIVQYERAMGLPGSVIVWKYVLRNALTSTVTQIGLVSGALLGGSVVIEAVFDWPGLGYYAVNSIIMSDYNAVLGFTIWASIIYILINVLVDIVHRLIDPRESGP